MRSKERKKEGIQAAITAAAVAAIRPIAVRQGKQLAERMLNPDGPAFAEQLDKIRARRRGGDGGSSGPGESGAGL